MNVLSLFDGISCGRVALERAGIKVDTFYASEIDKYAIQIAKKNYPDTIHIGDVNDIDFTQFIGKIDLLIGGSPCQGFSRAGQGLNFDDPRSKLFFKYVDALNIIKPKYFLLENVKMKKEWQDIISQYLGVKPIEINSELVSAQNRVRLYWTNIPGIKQPKDKGILLKDIVLPDVEPVALHNLYGGFKETSVRVFENKSPTIRTAAGGGHIPSFVKKDFIHSKQAIEYMNRQVADGRTHWDFKHHSDIRNDKSATVVANFFKGVPYNVFKDWDCIRKFHPVECERLQTLPTWEINLEVELYLDQAKNYVNAVNKSPKLQKLVGNVEKYELKEFVNIVKKNMNASHQLIKFIVQESVDMQIERQTNSCTNLKRKESNIIVDNVENYVKYPNQEQEENFVHSNAFMNITQEKTPHNGKVELHLKDNYYIYQMNGKKPLRLCGKEMMQLVEDVEKGFLMKSDNNSIYITLSRLGIGNLEQILIICYWYAKNVIDGFTVNKTKIKNILLSYRIPYTEGVSFTQRYKMIGNGWNVDTIVHLLSYIK